MGDQGNKTEIVYTTESFDNLYEAMVYGITEGLYD